MTGAVLESRHVCAALLAIGGALLAARLEPRRARAAWIALLIAGVAHAVWINARAKTLVNLNLVHYYLGAKYPVAYADFYRAVNAAIERPQTSLRDLEHPTVLLRDDTREQRAYYIDLLRAEGEVDTSLTLAELRQRALDGGAVRREAERILSATVPREHIERFREDVRRALVEFNAESSVDGEPRLIGTDYGFNGSPLYAALRHVDPTLYAPLGPASAWLNLAWQIAATLLIAWMFGVALGLDFEGRLACAALLFASWDCAGWALSGLVFAGLWLPVALALLAWRRGQPMLMGACIAWAALIKLFPFALLLPHIVCVVRARVTRTSARSSWLVLAGAAIATPVLAAVGMASGRSWLDFTSKIVAQFQSSMHAPNSVGWSDTLHALGIYESPLSTSCAVLVLVAFVALFASGGEDEFASALPRRSLALFAATGWLTRTWLNYYALAPLVLLPLISVRRRWTALSMALLCALACALPEFGDARLSSHAWLQVLKFAPYALIALWCAVIELELPARARWLRRSVAIAALLAVATVGVEAWRWRAIRRFAASADEALAHGASQRAFDEYATLVELAPDDAVVRTKYAIAAARVGRDDEARLAFERALARAPDNASAHEHFGAWRLARGELEPAGAELEIARGLAPCDEDVLLQLARVRLAQGRTADARTHVVRALELTPKKRELQQLLAQIDSEHR